MVEDGAVSQSDLGLDVDLGSDGVGKRNMTVGANDGAGLDSLLQ